MRNLTIILNGYLSEFGTISRAKLDSNAMCLKLEFFYSIMINQLIF